MFSSLTLEKFEEASASIPLRQLDRAFAAAGIALGNDPGGPVGARRAQFRRYVSSVDQHEARQRDRLGAALGALIGEVATSKIAFLLNAAESDGFAFEGRVLRSPRTAASRFAVTRVEDFARIDEHARRLASACRTVAGRPDAPNVDAGFTEAVNAALKALGLRGRGAGAAGRCLQLLGEVVADLDAAVDVSARDARLAGGAAVTFASFILETYTSIMERRSKGRSPDHA
jgi:hypothetical protein